MKTTVVLTNSIKSLAPITLSTSKHSKRLPVGTGENAPQHYCHWCNTSQHIIYAFILDLFYLSLLKLGVLTLSLRCDDLDVRIWGGGCSAGTSGEILNSQEKPESIMGRLRT